MFELIIFSSHDKWNSLCWILSVSRQQGGSFKHGSMLSRWEGEQIQAENGRKLGEATEETNIHQIISMRFFFCTQVLQLLPPQQTEKVASHFKSSPKNVQRSIFYVLSGFSYCVWQCDRSDKAMQKGGCTWDPGNFITPSQAVSVQDPGLCAGCPALRTGNMAQTTLCVIATSRRALWYVHLPWLVLQIALMSLPPCLCSLDSSH